jgi:VanZ family protein
MTAARPFRIALFVIACAVVAVLSLVPQDELPATDVSDKIEHFVAYAGLALLGLWAFPSRWRRLAMGLIAGGILMEVLQATLPFNRQGDVLDALANSAGVVIGLGLSLAVGRMRR